MSIPHKELFPTFTISGFGTLIDIPPDKFHFMKHTLLLRFALILFVFSPVFAVAKNNMVIFSNENKRFTVFVNGHKQNDRPEANVKIIGLDAYVNAVRIEFEESVVPSFNQNIYLVDGCVEVNDKEFSFIVEQPYRGMWKLRVTGLNDIQANPAIVPGQAVCIYNPNAIIPPANPAPAPVETAPAPPCQPMSAVDFAAAKASIEKQMMDDSKLKVAKQVVGTNCLTTAQVKEIMGMFTMERTKLDWAKFAYGKTSDPQNYYQLNDGFMFSSSVDELNKYIESQKK